MAKRKPPLAIEVDCPDCGSIFSWLPHGNQKPRSPKQRNRFHLMCALAFKAWPDTHRRQFNSKEECRKWLTMRSSPHYRTVKGRIPLEGMSKHQAMTIAWAVIRATPEYMVPQVEGGDIVIYAAKSTNEMTMGHREFNALNTMVQEVIETETTLKVDTLIHEHFKLKESTAHLARERAPKYIEPRDF